MSELALAARELLNRQKRVLNYVKELKNEALIEVKHRGSPVTSMSEDHEINAIGKEKLKIVKRLLDILAED